jgi:hypothetical protein
VLWVVVATIPSPLCLAMCIGIDLAYHQVEKAISIIWKQKQVVVVVSLAS